MPACIVVKFFLLSVNCKSEFLTPCIAVFLTTVQPVKDWVESGQVWPTEVKLGQIFQFLRIWSSLL